MPAYATESMTPYIKNGLQWELLEDVFSAHVTMKKGTIVNRYPSGHSHNSFNILDDKGQEILGVERHRMKPL